MNMFLKNINHTFELCK